MFELLFNHPLEAYRRGELVFQPLLEAAAGLQTGPRALAAAALALIVAVALAALLQPGRGRALAPRRRLTLGVLQGLFVGGVVVLLAGPALRVSTLAPGANTVAVLVDTSESMAYPAEPGGTSRLGVTQTLLQGRLLHQLSQSAEVATFTFGGSVRRDDLSALAPVAPETHLLRALEDVVDGFAGTPLAAVVVITDGADNDPGRGEVARLAAAGVPVHTVGIGPAELPGEVRLRNVAVPEHVPPHSRTLAELELRHSSAGAATVKIYDGPRLIAVEEHRLDAEAASQRLTVAFDSGPGGIRELAFVVEPPPGDLLPDNNRAERLLTVSERRRRVLYLEGEPRWEYKFLRRALAGDEVLTLTSWLRTTGRKTYRQGVNDPQQLVEGLPQSRSALYGYDVIVLGSLGAAALDDTQHRWLEAFVGERGGSLLALAGRESLADGGWDAAPLGAALPVQLSRGAGPGYRAAEGRVRVTAAGRRSPVTQLTGGEGADPWSALPPLGDYQRLGPLKPAATALLEVVLPEGPRPLLVVQPYGAGTAAVLASASTWRWRMRTPADDPRHTLFWRQLVRHLGEIARQRRHVSVTAAGDAIRVRLTERDEVFAPRAGTRAEAVVNGPRLVDAHLRLAPAAEPGVLEGALRAPASGVYRVDVRVAGDGAAVTRFVRAGDRPGEAAEPRQNRALLERIAEVTGGRYWTAAEAGAIPAALAFGSAGLRRVEHLALWNTPAAWLVLLVMKGGEWLLRRRWGLF